MTTESNNMACPICQKNIKLGQISSRSNPIHKYPAVRACPSCRTALCFALPRWIVPVMVIAAIVGIFAIIFAMQSLGAIDNSTAAYGGRRSKTPGVIGGFILAAIMLPAWMLLARKKMQINIATREDMRNYAGR